MRKLESFTDTLEGENEQQLDTVGNGLPLPMKQIHEGIQNAGDTDGTGTFDLVQVAVCGAGLG